MRYSREDACRAWVTYGIFRADQQSELLEEYGSAEAVYDRFVDKGPGFLSNRTNQYGLSQLSEHASKEAMHRMLLTMQQYEIGIIGMDDPRYPDSLRYIQQPPALLFYRGNLNCTLGKIVAVVGSRRASPQGIDTTHRICQELSQAGVSIVSGLAMGIDAAAHDGCLAGNSPTIAVLGCGLDVDYPMENVLLRDQILARNGLLLSEHPPGVRASKHVFQMRNRLISGLAKALIMMESQIQSGSMLTVHHALDQGKEVFAYPGIPGTEWAEGAHQLLREGANYFTSAQDILEDLGWESNAIPLQVQSKNEAIPSMSEDQRKVFSLLNQGERSFDQLAEASGLSAKDLSISLTILQMKGLIKALPGKIYDRI